MKRKIRNDNYRILHVIFIILIAGIFIYSALYGHTGNYPVQSASKWLTGKDSISTGLSRSFSAILHFDFAEAHRYNPYGIRVFVFFALQLLLRVFFLFAAARNSVRREFLITADSVFSIALFAGCFFPFLRALFQIIV